LSGEDKQIKYISLQFLNRNDYSIISATLAVALLAVLCRLHFHQKSIKLALELGDVE
jgi:hypothetical protein